MITGFAARALIALFAILTTVFLWSMSHAHGTAFAQKDKTSASRFAAWTAFFLALDLLLILCLAAA